MRTVIFDLDGTLADTAADMIAAANACFRALGAGDLLDPGADAATAFHGGRAMLRLGFARLGQGGEAEVDAAFPTFIAQYEADLVSRSRFYPGARDAVERLKAAGDRVAVCTNKPEALALGVLAGLGAADLFDAVIGADTLPSRKPDPAPYRAAVERAGGVLARSMMIGDTGTDLATARAAGVPCALVTFTANAAEVAALDPEARLGSFDGLDAVVARLLG
ncbi:HAD-IA family hydrolase [Sinisalibacter aestuarii]|uniref:phosphoglycolate phosphatase n=1 Tax=Sinisalibacter aestuarii TaxID=2949426 RepID=A0ABQ5LUB8_9RHOB|nr:HAD-IA family hydrolase [Sinisalibacter aestuarii]GKY88576.1 phosphoglycolate phosphatase [Sinisalibacter aestuarii]